MKTQKSISMGNLTDEQLSALEAMGFDLGETIEEPVDEPVIEVVNEPKPVKENPKFVFDMDMMDEEINEKIVLNAVQKAMRKVLQDNSREMSKARFFINGEDPEGLPYGNFNGAGDRAITMYQPDHPDAPKSGKNYGKVFYRWTDKRVVKLMEAIFEECGWDPSELEVEAE